MSIQKTNNKNGIPPEKRQQNWGLLKVDKGRNMASVTCDVKKVAEKGNLFPCTLVSRTRKDGSHWVTLSMSPPALPVCDF